MNDLIMCCGNFYSKREEERRIRRKTRGKNARQHKMEKQRGTKTTNIQDGYKYVSFQISLEDTNSMTMHTKRSREQI